MIRVHVRWRRYRRRWHLPRGTLELAAVACALALIVVLVLTSCSSSVYGGGGGGEVRNPREHVVYTLTGSAPGADLTWSTGDGGTQQARSVRVPLTTGGIRFNTPAGSFLYLSAQNAVGYGSLTCSIYIDGRLVDRHTSKGAYVIVTCTV